MLPSHQFSSESSKSRISSPALNDNSLSSAASKSYNALTCPFELRGAVVLEAFDDDAGVE
ncbi:unnamed protein product [Schistosoma mattheei]|uniref:Uncharacterized protein n=1 Tax=Schistosoma mattheei TaxID=31246 RepID=A0A3P8GRC4_9TREM|nr:unnamed protein product [Schistosoma mattheei]